jgi:hypothetical protein
MTEHFGDVSDVRASLKHESRHAVTQQVATPALVHICPAEIGADSATEPVGAQWRAHRREEEHFARSGGLEDRPDDPEVETDPEESPLSDRDVTVLGPFASVDEEGPTVKVHVPCPQ